MLMDVPHRPDPFGGRRMQRQMLDHPVLELARTFMHGVEEFTDRQHGAVQLVEDLTSHLRG